MIKNQKGSILILTIFSLITLSLLAFSVGYTVRQKLHVATTFESRTQLRLASEAAAAQVSVFLQKNFAIQGAYHSLQQGWADNQGLWKEAKLGRVIYDVIADRNYNSSATRYGLVDENSKININQASQATLEALIRHTGMEDEEARRIAAAIRDWRDEDTDLNDGGAESKDYMNKKPPYRAKDAPFDSLDELQWVEGISLSLYLKLSEFLTLYGDEVNLNTASPVVLTAMGIDPQLVGSVFSFREGRDGIIGTADDGVFTSLNEAGVMLLRQQLVSEVDAQNFDRAIAENFTVKSTFFKMNFFGRLENQKQKLNTQVIFDHKGKVLQWFERYY